MHDYLSSHHFHALFQIIQDPYHAVRQFDPDQDLQSGFKLFTWYDVCCIIRVEGFRSGGGIMS